MIRASEAHTTEGSIITLINGSRNVGFISDVGRELKETIASFGIRTIPVRKNKHNTYVIYNEGYYDDALELSLIADKYDGFLAYNASTEDVYRIGELLSYEKQDVIDYLKRTR